MNTYRVSELTSGHKAERAYVAHWARNPDTGSAFDRATWVFRRLPECLLLFVLIRCLRYDGLISSENREFVGHVFFQRHRHHWGIFSVFVAERFRGKGFAKKMIAECVRQAYVNPRVLRVHIGGGCDPAIQHIAELAAKNKLGLPFLLAAGNRAGVVALVRSFPSEAVHRLMLENLRRMR